MGGYPYELISPPEVEALMQRLGFARVDSTTSPAGIGFFGSGCDEYLLPSSRLTMSEPSRRSQWHAE